MTTITSNPGILLIDKPKTWTSHDVVAKIRHLTGVKTVGHAGTLDPLATGLLIVLVGKQYTKRQTEFLKMDKEYVCTARLGMETDTYDTDGQILKTATWSELKEISQEQLQQALLQFVGVINQTVPAYSAVKVKGKKLYNLARQDKVDLTTLPQRQVNIYELQLIETLKDETKQQFTLTIKVKCSSGTYIRSLVHDLGQKLGVGACVTELRRTHIGSYSIDQSVQL
jgi:tRNA pseudouridine55 synthase